MKDVPEGAVCGVDGCEPVSAMPEAAANAPVLDIAIVSDVICPWCYVGKKRFEKALAALGNDLPVRVSWHPFQLNPQMPKDGMERREYRMRKFGSLERSQQMDAQLAAVGAQEGIAFRYDLIVRTPNTFNAHRLIWGAGQAGVQDRMSEALFRAYFCQGRDVGNVEVLADIAADCGIERAAALAFLSSNEGAREVADEEEIARRAGVSGVPAFFANGRPLFVGAQPAETMAATLRSMTQIAAG